MRIIDITLPLQPGLAVWPGDTEYSFQRTLRKEDGQSVNVGAARLSMHTGTHTDAPFHFDSAGQTIDAVPLEPYVGPCQVVVVPPGDAIRRSDVEHQIVPGRPRILFRTDAWTDHTRFPTAIPVMDVDLVRWLGERGTLLVGFDVPSVDAIQSKDLPIHHALAAHGIAILESLDLRTVSAGSYELAALPMKFVAADGAPVRAVLMPSRES